MKLTKFEDSLQMRLRDADYAQSYLQAALNEGGKGEWLVALREVASASEGGLKYVAEQAKVGRESMYKSLSRSGNPRWETIQAVLDTLGFELIVQKKDHAPGAAKSRQSKGYVRDKGSAVLPKSGSESVTSRSSLGAINKVAPSSGKTLSNKPTPLSSMKNIATKQT